MLKPAIIFDDGRVFVEFTFDKFSKLLEEYFLKTGSTTEALKLIEKDLREETKYVK